MEKIKTTYQSFAEIARIIREGKLGQLHIGDTISTRHTLRDRLLWRIIGINADAALDGTPETVTVMLCNPPIWCSFDGGRKGFPYGCNEWEPSDVRARLQGDMLDGFDAEDRAALFLRLYGNSAAFFVVSTAFFTAAGQDSYPCVAKIAYRGAQEEPVQVCGAGEGSNRRRQKNAGWARSGLHAVQHGRLRPSVAQSAEAPDRRTPSPTPCKQTPSMKGAGNADIGEVVNFFILRCTFIKKIAREVGRKTDQDASR